MRFALLGVLGVVVINGSAAAQTEFARVVGRVVSHPENAPLASASVDLNGRRVIADAQGRFVFDSVAPGKHSIVVEIIGYETRRDSLVVRSAEPHDVEIRVATKPIQLPPVAVIVTSRWLTDQGFYARREERGRGAWITREEIERRNPTNLTDMLRNAAGAKILLVPTPRGSGRVVRFSRVIGTGLSTTEVVQDQHGCEPALFLDGQRYKDRIPQPDAQQGGLRPGSSRKPPEGFVDSFDIVHPMIVEGIEVYPATASMPIQYRHPCGVVLIWTRRN